MIIQSTHVYIGSMFLPVQIEVEGEKIVGIYPYNHKPVDADYGDFRIVPGFYDVHAHGALGYDTTIAHSEEGLRRWLKALPKEGVCGILPTTLTNSHEKLKGAVAEVAAVKEKNPEGAEILGIHFEGPYLNVKHKGAQPEKYIVHSDVQEFAEYQDAAKGLIRIITLAPEQDDDFALTRYCAEHGVNVSLGHTDASFEQAMLAIANGAKGFTHTYNAMTPFSHRANGVTGASLRCHDLYSEVICDGNHSSYEALNILFGEKKQYAMMVSDSLLCKGFPAGSILGDQDFGVEIFPDGSAHLLDEKRTFAGSTLAINKGLKILVEEAMVPFDVALNCCSLNPAKYLGIDDHKGRLSYGYDADIVVLDPEYDVVQTYCRGKAQF